MRCGYARPGGKMPEFGGPVKVMPAPLRLTVAASLTDLALYWTPCAVSANQRTVICMHRSWLTRVREIHQDGGDLGSVRACWQSNVHTVCLAVSNLGRELGERRSRRVEVRWRKVLDAVLARVWPSFVLS